MYYEINVTLNGKHLFATAERSIWDMEKLCQIYHTFKKKFPESEGYGISIIQYETTGHVIDEMEIA